MLLVCTGLSAKYVCLQAPTVTEDRVCVVYLVGVVDSSCFAFVGLLACWDQESVLRRVVVVTLVRESCSVCQLLAACFLFALD